MIIQLSEVIATLGVIGVAAFFEVIDFLKLSKLLKLSLRSKLTTLLMLMFSFCYISFQGIVVNFRK